MENIKIIKTQEEFDKLALAYCEANNGCNTEECVESWKAGYLHVLQQLYYFRVSDKYKDCLDYVDKIDEKIDEYTYLEIFSL